MAQPVAKAASRFARLNVRDHNGWMARKPIKATRKLKPQVSSTCEGFFRVPPIWVRDKPQIAMGEPDFLTSCNETVCRGQLECGIKIRVQRDGLFMFDFSDFDQASYVELPQYAAPLGMDPYTPLILPSEVGIAADRAEGISVFRTKLMNVFLACLDKARKPEGIPPMLSQPITTKDTYKAIDYQETPTYTLNVRNPRDVLRSVVNGAFGSLAKPFPERPVYDIESIQAAFQQLNELLKKDPVFAVQTVELAYVASIRAREKRFGEAIVLSWSVCEQLINRRYFSFIDTHKSKRGAEMPSERRKKLSSSNYTASIISELLELTSNIDHALYRRLEIGRKSRNNWVHKHKEPKRREVYACLEACRSMIWDDFDFRLHFGPFEGSRSGRTWPLSMLQDIEKRRGGY